MAFRRRRRTGESRQGSFGIRVTLGAGIRFPPFIDRDRQRRPTPTRFKPPNRPTPPIFPEPKISTKTRGPGPIFPDAPAGRLPKLGNIVLRGLGRLAGPVGVILIGKDILDLQREAKRQEREADARAKRERELQKQADQQVRTVIIEDFPAPIEPEPQPEPLILPPTPQLPEITTPTEIDVVIPERRVAVPKKIVFPEIFPEISVPRPTPTRRTTTPAPSPTRSPSVKPKPALLPFLFPSTLPSVRPSVRPSTRPSTRPASPTQQPNLTRFQQPALRLSPSTSTSPMFQTQPSSPTRSAQQNCEVVKRRRRRKGKCREGFFREFPGSTRYVTWREFDCDEQVERATKRIIKRISSNASDTEGS